MRLFSKWFFMITAKRFYLRIVKIGYLNQVRKYSNRLEIARRYNVHWTMTKKKNLQWYPVLRHSTVLRSLMITWHRTSIARSMLSHQLTKWSNPLQVEYSHQQLLINFQTSPIKIPITTGNECMNFFQVKGVVVLGDQNLDSMRSKDYFCSKYLNIESKLDKQVALKKHIKKWGAVSHQMSIALPSKSVVHCSQDKQVNWSLQLWRCSVMQQLVKVFIHFANSIFDFLKMLSDNSFDKTMWVPFNNLALYVIISNGFNN